VRSPNCLVTITQATSLRLLGISFADAWVAATALYYRVPSITNNRVDYKMIDGLSRTVRLGCRPTAVQYLALFPTSTPRGHDR